MVDLTVSKYFTTSIFLFNLCNKVVRCSAERVSSSMIITFMRLFYLIFNGQMELIIIFIIGVIVLTFDSFLYIWRCRIFISHENNHQGLCPPEHISRAGATKTVHTHFILCLHQILDYYAIKEIFIFTCALITLSASV